LTGGRCSEVVVSFVYLAVSESIYFFQCFILKLILRVKAEEEKHSKKTVKKLAFKDSKKLHFVVKKLVRDKTGSNRVQSVQTFCCH
jgi:hypothetical protein